MSSTTLVALLLLSVLAAVSLAESDCQGKVGAYAYDLRPLASLIGPVVDLWTTDEKNQVFIYHVCGVVSNNFCQTVTDSTPATCMKDSRVPAQYHDLGSQRTAKFGQLPDASESDGFTLSFTGGEDDRASVIHYWCDPSTEFISWYFIYINENPSKTYNLGIRTKYACPINDGPTPTPTPPNGKDLCCLYLYKSDPKVTKTLCSSTCPPSFSGYALESNWTVSACSDCFFHR